MELRLLRYFLTVAREESISGAAGTLHLTQPTLSRQMMDLEQQLGVKLFLRGSRRITLTDDGMLLRKRAEEIIDLVDKTEAAFAPSGESVRGDIYIGSGETHAVRMLAKLTKEIHTDYPEIQFHLFSGNGEDVAERLDKGLIDFGLFIDPVSISKYDSLLLPAKDVWGILMRSDAPLAARDSVHPEDLWQVPLIASRQTLKGEAIASWIKKDYGALNIVATYNLIYNASLLVEEGLGYAFCLDGLVNTAGSSLCFKPLAPRLEADLYLAWKKYQVFSKASDLFLKGLQTAFAGQPGQ